jgi:uncharacterized protein YqjF (DUF2071 family)
MHPSLRSTEHRPWPLPAGAWLGRQSWVDLLFAHWPVAVEQVRHLVPPRLTIQEFDGSTWVGLVPFRMEGVMLRGLPDSRYVSAFPELNVRLYVELDGAPGVWFLSLDADNALAVWGGRNLFHLPYHRARMRVRSHGDAIDYESRRDDGSGSTARYRGRHRPLGERFRAQPGTLEHWLTERYCLYAQSPRGTLRRTEVHHAPWPLQPAEVTIVENQMFAPHGITVSGTPLCHFARRLDVLVWPPRACG